MISIIFVVFVIVSKINVLHAENTLLEPKLPSHDSCVYFDGETLMSVKNQCILFMFLEISNHIKPERKQKNDTC